MGGTDQARRAQDGGEATPEAWLSEWRGEGDRCTLAIVALTGFEIINAAYGRDAGDMLIAAAEGRIGEAMAAHDASATAQVRRDGAAFFVGLPVSVAAAQPALDAIAATLARAYQLGGRTIHLGARMGIAAAMAGNSSADLVARARAALAEARGGEGATTRTAPPGAERPLSELAADLHRAIERDEIEILFQPQVALASGRIEAVEALARWQHPTLGSLGAATLLAASHRADLGLALSEHIHAAALARVAAWPAALSQLRVAVNVTAADIARVGFVSGFLARVADSGVAPTRVTAEITEGGLIDDLDAAAALLGDLRDRGCRVAIDDFGTGYSSLAYLTRLPLDYLKIDRQLTQCIAGDRRHRVVVEGVIAMAAALGLETIAEGVEDEAQRALLAARGCTYYQGFLCSRPVDSAGLLALVENERGRDG